LDESFFGTKMEWKTPFEIKLTHIFKRFQIQF